MTPEQEQAIIAVAEAGLDAALAASFERLMQLIRDGTPPREAVQTVMESFQGAMAETLATALSGLLGAAVGTAEVLRMDVGLVPLSRKLYAQAQTTSDVVAGIVRRHTQGFLDARGLALELFEGYAFRSPEAEPLKMSPSNPRLPQYLREALLSDDGLAGDMQRAFARIQARGLTTGALNAAYNELLDTLDTLEAGKGSALLERRMRVAFFERLRYFANRIATTELHRAYAQAEARRILDDQDIDFVQIRRAPGQQEACICDLYAGRDQWGKGPGVYPKARAPVPPYHPHCRCTMAPRLDLTDSADGKLEPEADVYFLRRLSPSIAGRIVGSQGKLDAVMRGVPLPTVVNAGRDPAYWVRTAGEVVP